MNTNEGGSKTVALMDQKPLDFIHFGDYKITERMSASFQDFEKKYGGKVFVIFSIRTGDKKVIKNKEVLDDIRNEIERLKKAIL